jgi:hypothetical protein
MNRPCHIFEFLTIHLFLDQIPTRKFLTKFECYLKDPINCKYLNLINGCFIYYFQSNYLVDCENFRHFLTFYSNLGNLNFVRSIDYLIFHSSKNYFACSRSNINLI